MDGLSKAVNGLVKVGVGVFLLILIMTLSYSAYGTARNTIQVNYGATSAGLVTNFTTYAGGAANQFGSNIGLAIFAVIFAAIILAVVSSLREATGSGESGGFL